jgi:signal transduction histidine kinase
MARKRPLASFHFLLARTRARIARALWPCDEAEHAARAAAATERLRIARDLHDGPAQELAFVAMQSRFLADRSGDPELEELAAAASRALAESKQAIYALASVHDETGSLDDAVCDAAQNIAARSGATVSVDFDAPVQAPTKTREELVRIVREAVWNGIRHGDATSFAIELSDANGLHLRIADNGAGFDPGTVAGQVGLGLESMRERATALGGDLDIRSLPGGGTEVEVSIP